MTGKNPAWVTSFEDLIGIQIGLLGTVRNPVFQETQVAENLRDKIAEFSKTVPNVVGQKNDVSLCSP